MRVKCRLRRLLSDHGFDHHGIIGEIASALDVHRHTVAKLYSGNADTLRLDVLGDLADWLIAKGVPAEKLPQELLGPDALWDHIRRSNTVMIYLGEYETGGPQRLARSMIARHDAGVATDLVRQLARYGLLREVDISYVPLRYSDDGTYSVLHKDRNHARHLFEAMRARERHGGATSAFLIGSQKINFMVEQLVASCFDFHPFEAAGPKRFVPFYLLYRSGDPALPSCFGGRAPPPNFSGRKDPGIYYMTKDGWQSCLYREGHQDAGIVITSYQPANNAVEVALFGFSSAATASVGKYFLERADEFWPPTADLGDRQIGVYICRFSYASGEMWANQNFQCKVEPLSIDVLTRRGDGSRDRTARKKRGGQK
jgi:hypothetical protein